ncbi:MAG: hypothetical protein AAB493_02255 [Patescibacteria group bacterium]
MNIKFFKFEKSFKKKDYQVSFDIYWKVILNAVFIIIIISFIYGFSVFMEMNKDYVSSDVNMNEQVEKDRKTRIDKVLEYFSEREKKSEIILNSPSPVVDPSI